MCNLVTKSLLKDKFWFCKFW